MFVDTILIDETLKTLDETYQNLLREESLPDSPAIKYAFYNEALKIVKAQPLEDSVTQSVMTFRLQNILLCLSVENNLQFATIRDN